MSYCQAAYTYISTTMPSGNIEEEPWIQTLANTWNYVDSNGTWHSSTLVQNDYTYDNNGQRLTNKITAADGSSRTETYGYDNINRLTSVNYGDGETQGYTFDAMGNRLQKTDSATGNEGYTYNAANMLLTRGTGSYTNDL
ncbi:MAG: hypothetical protein KGK12_11920, partial [Armatimonadetes bacterium]|nr:hypothetical protein [Armatimonadota bacterium]